MHTKRTFTLIEAAELLSCHTETLRRAIMSGDLKAAKLGKSYRISRPDLEEYWQECGGGRLFEESPQVQEPRVAKEPEKKEPRKPEGPEQLKLPT